MQKNYIRGLALTALLFTTDPTALQAQTFSPVAPARGFNVFTSNEVTLVAGDTHGPVATGGNLKLSGQTIMVMNNSGVYPFGAGNGNNYGLVVNGKVLYTSGNVSYVNQGYIRLGDATGSTLHDKDNNNANTNLQITAGAFDSNPRVQLQRNQATSTALQAHGINFTTAFDSLKMFSEFISEYEPSDPVWSSTLAAVTIPDGMNPHITLTPNKVNFITLTGTELNNLKHQGSITFDNKPSATQPLVINVVAPGSFVWDIFDPGGLDESDSHYILWNFYSTTALELAGGPSTYGTILAPFADINKTGGNNTNGQIISKSLRIAYGEIHYYTFIPLLPGGVTPLPLSGLKLYAQPTNDAANLLHWQAINEREMVAYSVERSENGKDFHQLEVVYSLGNGDHTYKWQDQHPPATTAQLFYRIKGVDRAGDVSYSNVAALRSNGLQPEIKFGPNPFTNYINFAAGTPAEYTYRIIDITGCTLKADKIGSGQISGLETLPPATYWLLLQDAQGQPVLRQQMIKR